MREPPCLLVVSIMVCLMSAGAWGQDAIPPDPDRPWEDDPRAQLRVTFEPYGVTGFETDFDAGGDLAVRRAGWRLSLRQTISRRWTVALDAENEFSFTDYTLPPALGGGDPIDLLTTVRLLPSATYRVSRRWTTTVTARVEYTAESDADFGDSILGGGFFTARRRVSDRLTIGFGVGVMQRLESSVQVFPVPYLDWRPTDRLRLFTDHLGLNIEQALGEAWFLTFRARYEPREYRLSDGPGSLLRGGVLRDESAFVGVELGYRPTPGVEVAVEVGSIVHQSIELLNAGGGEPFDDEADPTAFIAGRLRVRF